MAEEKKQEVKEKSAEEKSAESKKKEVAVPKKFEKLVEEIEKMSVLDLAELVKILEEKFGVSAASPAVFAGAIPAAGESGAAAGAPAKSQFNIELVSAGDSKINVIKTVKEITGVGLKEAKDLVDAAPKVIKENVVKEEAEEIKKKLETAGAKVELK